MNRDAWAPDHDELVSAIYRYTGSGSGDKLGLLYDKMVVKAQIAVLMRMQDEIRAKHGRSSVTIEKEIALLRVQLDGILTQISNLKPVRRDKKYL